MDDILFRVSCMFVADVAKTGSQIEDLLEVEPLVCRVLVMWLQGDVLCVSYSSARILRNSLMGYAPVMLISLSWNTRK